MATTPLEQLDEHGQSVWIDFLSRDVRRGGRPAGPDRPGRPTASPPTRPSSRARSPTATPTTSSCARSSRRRARAEGGLPRSSPCATSSGACDLLKQVHDDGDGKDGWVSLEVDPNLAHDTEGTIEEAKRLHALVDRQNLLVKIPATKEGLPAIEESIAARHPDQRHADLLARAPPRGRRGLRPRARAPRRGRRRPGQRRLGRLLLRLARRHRGRQAPRRDRRPRRAEGQARDRERQARLPDLQGDLLRRPLGGARGQGRHACSGRLWASTSTKNDAYKDTIYVEELVGPETVNTMPRELVEAVLDHGDIRGNTIEEDLDGARKVFEDLKAAGHRLRRRRGDAREGGRGEVRQVLQGAVLGRRVQARRAGGRMSELAGG